MSLNWNIRTVLASEAAPLSVHNDDGKVALGTETSGRLGSIDIWNYLISLSWDESGTKSEPKMDYTKLRHYKATDFILDSDKAAKHVGDGASYSVERCTLNWTTDGESTVVAIKKLKIFQEHGLRDEARSAAHQRSVATVLKELRILTHRPLQSHLNIVSLLGYRSDPAPQSSLLSTIVSLVVEFAPFGTLRDFCHSLAPDNKLDLIGKAHLMHDIASGIEALHKCAIAHGDVKMENTLVFEGYRRPYVAKLSDFGHSLVDLHTPDRGSQVYLGTSIFNAPEIRSREYIVPMQWESLFKCDTYSFGLLCWELILGGMKYYKTLGDIIGTEDITAVVSWLSTLPKDELLFRSIISLKEAHGSKDAPLVQVITRVLQACLRDEPHDRENMENIIKYFRQQEVLCTDLSMRRIDLPSTQDKPWAATLKPFVGDNRPFLVTSAISQMPLVVQTDCIDQLRYAIKTSTSNVNKRSSLFELAMCYLLGIGIEKVDIAKALGLLVEAAQIGSCKALAVVFRLHDSLLGEIPSNLWEISHPIARLEKSLSQLDSRTYFTERLRRYENMHQADALKRAFDIQQNGKTILTGVHLLDAHVKLQQVSGLCVEGLECISYLEGDEMGQIQGNLLITAARLNLLPLVEFLFAHSEPTWSPGVLMGTAWSEALLNSACRGGHLDMLRLLLCKGVSMLSTGNPRATPLHWLGLFEPEEASIALELLISAPGGKECLLESIPGPGIQIGDCIIWGTPLEVAIATNNALLVEIFLHTKVDTKPQDYPRVIGWTANTYPLAVTLSLHHILPSLLDSERTYRDSLWTVPTLPPLGLFDLVHAHDPLLPLLIHGQAAPGALKSSINFILGTGAAINDENSDGATPLSHAARYAPCRFSLDPISTLISHGARFSRKVEPISTVDMIMRRRDTAAPAIVRYLIEEGLLPLDSAVLAITFQSGGTAITAAVLDTCVAGQALDVNTPLLIDEERVPPLFVAIGLDNAKAVQLLLDHGAELEVQWRDKTPLEAAVMVSSCDGDTIDLLLARGARIDLGSYNILQCAAMGAAMVRGLHVLFHLLENERIRALVNTVVGGLTPLVIAIGAGNVAAVHALLQAGARIESGEVLSKLLVVAVDAGRRPQKASLPWREKAPDNEELYQWRLAVEDIILTLMDKGDPGHGRTRVHVAVQLGNLRRVVELVEQQGQRMLVGDREKLTPGALLEDFDGLEKSGEDDEYLTGLIQLREYVQQKLIEDAAADATNPDALENWLGDDPHSPEDSEANRQTAADLQVTLQKLKLEEEETELSVGDGTESIAEREVKLRMALELQKKRLGETDLNTLRTTTVLYEVLSYQGKFEEAEELQKTVLVERQAQLPPNHVDLFESLVDKVYITCGLGRIQEANSYALAISLNAFDTFGSKHPVTFKVETARASTESLLGNYEEAVKIQEAALEFYDQIAFNQAFSDSSEDDDSLDFSTPLFYLRASLTIDYCRAQKFEAATELAKLIPHRLRVVKRKDFFQVFDTLVSVAAWLDLFGQHEASESILTTVVETCLEVHGERKSYAIHTALKRLSFHYRQRCMWEKEAKWLQKLVDHLKSTIGPNQRDTIEQQRDLATAFWKHGSWVEASLLQEQVLKVLEQSFSGDILELAAVKAGLCETLWRQGQLEKSETYGWEAVLTYRAELGDDHETTLDAERQLSLTLSFAAKFDEAIDLVQRHITSAVLSHGEIHNQTLIAVEILCAILVRARRLDEAEVQAERCLHISNHMPDTTDDVVSSALHILATCKELKGELDEARTLYAASLERSRVNGGSVATSDTLTAMCTLSRLHLQVDDYAAAEPLAREVLAAAATDSELARLAANDLGRVCEKTERNSEAVGHYQVAVDISRQLFGDAAEATLDCLQDLVRAVAAEGAMTEAFELAVELLRRQRETRGEYHEDTVETKKELVFIYPALGFWPEAERMQRDLLRFMEAAKPEEPEKLDEVCILLEMLVESCGKQGRWDEAEAFGRRAIDYQMATVGIEDQATLRTIASLALVLVDVGKIDEAEGMLDLVQETCQHVFDVGDDERDIAQPARAYSRFKQGRLDEAILIQRTVVANDRHNLDAILFLVQLHEKLGDYEEARKIMRKADSIAFSASGKAGEELEKPGLLRTHVQNIRLKTATRDFDSAVIMGKAVLSRTAEWHLLNYAYAELYLACLEAMETLYKALGEENDLRRTRLMTSYRHGPLLQPALTATLDLRTLGLGNPQLSMHSIREMGGTADVSSLRSMNVPNS
ncbi:serine threonine kinase [Fusarium mundagurra]|uniref:Serine threonine kinase n=1 Tax=Fusarium mundagurra TaxID=1567541 RepID=A0A8H5XX74_9HYPO|nr:serine threonine kinase [Fusarium mundagurra]